MAQIKVNRPPPKIGDIILISDVANSGILGNSGRIPGTHHLIQQISNVSPEFTCKSGPSDLRASLEARGEAVVEFTWSGLVSDHKAAQASLAAKLKEERAKADANHEKLNIIGHSWGSVLGYGAASTSDTKVDNLITIGSPLRSGLEKPKNVEHWANYWSVTDPVSWPSSGVVSDTNEPIIGGHSAYWDDPYVRAGINLAISSNPSGQNGKK